MSSPILEDHVDVVICSPNESFWGDVKNLLSGFYPYRQTWVNKVDDLLEVENLEKIFIKEHGEEELFNPLLAIVEAQEDTQKSSEWVQALKMSYPHVPTLVIFKTEAPIVHQVVKKNGASKTMHYPYDAEFISDIILELAPVDLVGDSIPVSALVPVDLEDFEPDTEIPSGMYIRLPANNKTLCLRKKDSKVDERTLKKFLKSPSHRVLIKKTELKAFMSYARDVMQARGNQDLVSATERFQNTKYKIQNMMATFLDEDELDYDEGKKILEDCESILEDLLVHKNISDDRILRLLRSHTGHIKTNYNDAINVCAYSAIFAQILKFEPDECKEIALGGLLHNIGLAGIPTKFTTKAINELEEEDWAEYKLYPKRAIFMIKRRKVPLLEIATKCIEQSMERIDGSGFPKGYSGVAVSKFSRVVNIAIEFNKLTSMNSNGKFYNPRDAIFQLIKDNQEVASLDLRNLTVLANYFKKHYKTAEERDELKRLVG